MGQWLEWMREVASTHAITRWGGIQILAMGATLAWFARRARRTGQARLALCLALSFAGAAVGAVALGVALRIPAWMFSGFRVSLFAHGDIMAYGALLGLSATFAALAHRAGSDPLAALDLLAPCAGVLVFFARIGCFIAGCDFGTVTNVPWAVRYPPHTAAFRRHLDAGWIHASDATSLPVHPAQLYEALVGLAMVGVGIWMDRSLRRADRRRPPGIVFAAVATTYAAGRFAVEAFRGDDRGTLGPLSTPQWISVTVVVYLALRVWGRWQGASDESASLTCERSTTRSLFSPRDPG